MPLQLHQRKNPFWIITAGLCITAILIGAMSWKIYIGETSDKALLYQQFTAERLRFDLNYYNAHALAELRLASYGDKAALTRYARAEAQLQQAFVQVQQFAHHNRVMKPYAALYEAWQSLVAVEQSALEQITVGNLHGAQNALSDSHLEQRVHEYTQATYQVITATNLNAYWLELCNNLFLYQALQMDAVQLAVATHRRDSLPIYDDYHHRIMALLNETEVNGEEVLTLKETRAIFAAYHDLDTQNRAILSALKEKKFTQAHDIFNSKTYAAQEQRLQDTVHNGYDKIAYRIDQEFHSHNLDIFITVLEVLVILVLFASIWLYILKSIQFWQRKLIAANTALTETNQFLDTKVAERTFALQQAYEDLQREIGERQELESALVQNQKMQAVGTLAAGLAHDFNNLLAVILAHSEFLAKQLSDAAQQQALERIMATTRTASTLMRQLLTFARKGMHQEQALQLNAVVTQTLSMLQPTLPDNIHIATVLAEQLPDIQGDPNELTQLLMNLVLNAKDAMSNGGDITITTERVVVKQPQWFLHKRLEPGTYLRLSVTDTGCGIAPEKIKLIFDPFYTTKEVGKGTGLGLSSVYGIVQQHHATIDVESKLDQGSCFSVYFCVGVRL